MSHPLNTSQAADYRDFLAADQRRRGDAVELGIDFADEHGLRHRVCWYVETGELTIERIPDLARLDVEDFHAGITTVHVLARLDRDDLERRLGTLPTIDRCRPHTTTRLHELLARPA